MADEMLWFVPVTGGGPTIPHGAGTGPIRSPASFNVQWDTDIYPESQDPEPEHPIFEVETITAFSNATGGGEEPDTLGMLSNCYAQFRWYSCADGDEGDITMGGQLNIGTVFARQLPTVYPSSPGILRWNTVEVWAKYRVSDKTRLSWIELVLNDSAPANIAGSGDLIGVTTDNVWNVGYAHHQDASWSGVNSSNLRATLNFLGTTDDATVGLVTVDIEWFAFRLSNQELPE